MPDRKHALLVSWLFPPHGSVGAKRAYRFARHLPSAGWDATVLCGRDPPRRLRDPTPWSLPSGASVIADYDATWLSALANSADARAHSTAESVARRTARRRALGTAFADFLHDALPTETIAIHVPHALRAAARLVDRSRCDLVWTTSYPYSSHLIGVALKRRFGIPFVADLRDPWTLSFVHDRKFATTRAIESSLEQFVFRHADRITVTTESLAEAYRERYPAWASRFIAIRNAFDPIALDLRLPPQRPIRLVHFGHVYGERTLGPVLEALGRVVRRESLTIDALRLENYGRMHDADREIVARLGLEPYVAIREPLPYAQGIAALRQAHVALLPAWGSEHGPLFLPGKLYDYLLAETPILAVGKNPELAQILEVTRSGRVFDPVDVSGIERSIAATLAGVPIARPDRVKIQQFDSATATRALADVFDEVLAARQRSAYTNTP